MANDLKENYFDFVFTQDSSVGLYNHEVEDIYHSVFGAKSEAEEKFVEPLNFSQNFSYKKEIKVLDICFGIGYNTKALLKKILTSDYSGKIFVDALECDKNLVLISPFLKDGYFKKFPQMSYVLLSNLIDLIYKNKDEVMNILSKSANKKFIETFYRDLVQKYKKMGYSYDPERGNNAFLHNIYYHCISRRNKKPLGTLKKGDFTITPYFNDARDTVKSLVSPYDIIFLDAFTPSKLPTLWSLQFFEQLYRLSKEDGILITYSNSSAVRHAMLEAGFVVGKLFDKDKRHCGTIASKNDKLIEQKLDGYDIGLAKTSCGIYYIDKGLNNSPEEILSEHTKRKHEMNLESSSSFIKRFKKETVNA